MVRIVLLLVLFILVARMFWRVVDNIIEAATGRPAGGGRHQQPGVPMVRDPVCGTFLLPERAVSLVDRGARVYFCSDVCRDQYRAGRASGSAGRAEGRTA